MSLFLSSILSIAVRLIGTASGYANDMVFDANDDLYINEPFTNKISVIDKLKGRISELCNAEKKHEIDTLKESIKKIEDFLANEFSNTEYTKLFSNIEI